MEPVREYRQAFIEKGYWVGLKETNSWMTQVIGYYVTVHATRGGQSCSMFLLFILKEAFSSIARSVVARIGYR